MNTREFQIMLRKPQFSSRDEPKGVMGGVTPMITFVIYYYNKNVTVIRTNYKNCNSILLKFGKGRHFNHYLGVAFEVNPAL